MPICHNCDANFPNTILIDGTWKNLNKRKYCLQCSPFNKHNTKKISCKAEHKKCPRCFKIKTLDLFYARKDKRPSAYCIDCAIEQTLERTQATKQKCIDYKGGKCQGCGYNKYIGALEFHHRDRVTKSYDISKKLRGHSFEKLKLELDKCVLVCSVCHKEIEAGIRICPE